MPSLLILYDREGWAYHREALALARYAPSHYSVSTLGLEKVGEPPALTSLAAPPDALYVLPQVRPEGILQFVAERGWPTKVIRRWSSGWPRRIPLFYRNYRDCDRLLINHEAYWRRTGKLSRAKMIPNGVDRSIFAMRRPLAERTPRVLWCGSMLHREVKGYERFVVPLFAELQARGIDCEALLVDSKGDAILDTEQMVEWYNSGTVLLCASSAEGTPSVALEAASCGCTVVSTRVGNMEELIEDGVNGILVDRTLDAMRAGVLEAVERAPELAAKMQERIAGWCWSERSRRTYALIDETLSGKDSTAAAKTDLRDEVTVFVTTVGGPSYELCRVGLQTQDVDFRLEVIENVAPMSAAFQQMIERCQTPYYVQLDEDMLLYPSAVGELYRRILQTSPSVACCLANLYDPHLGRMIHGVKIFRHAITRDFAFRDVEGCDVDQFVRLQEAGFELRRPAASDESSTEGEPLGLHGPVWTATTIYDRYANLQRKLRRRPRPMGWFRDYPQIFLDRFLAEGREEDFFALMGVLSGRLADLSIDGEKDFRTYDETAGLQAAREFWRTLHGSQES